MTSFDTLYMDARLTAQVEITNEATDELGMFVEEEAPFCWAHETKVSEDRKYATLVNQHIEMVNRDRTQAVCLII